MKTMRLMLVGVLAVAMGLTTLAVEPVDWVAAYDSAAFLETKQYSGTSSTEG